MGSQEWYLLLLNAVAVERVVELVVATRNGRWARARGGVEYGAGHYPVMVALHTGLLIACGVEVLAADRPFVPVVGWIALGAVIVGQVLRWWCVRSLGPLWNTRVIVVPEVVLVTAGPYRWLRHPNYVAVVIEVAALPLVHGAWVTAAVFTAANAALLTVRIRTEDRALDPHRVTG